MPVLPEEADPAQVPAPRPQYVINDRLGVAHTQLRMISISNSET
jgi:hypothetical protein